MSYTGTSRTPFHMYPYTATTLPTLHSDETQFMYEDHKKTMGGNLPHIEEKKRTREKYHPWKMDLRHARYDNGSERHKLRERWLHTYFGLQSSTIFVQSFSPAVNRAVNT